ncbi:cytochrome P450 [Gordonia sp. zg691]|uniref:Cytochrome P450 n=1 Tax=Gordonia jinghuaiqii TaxID=2758710 RepID=A0A7D7R4Z8_9ACTN|nr:cytochrome P450 [Gordonia jinghuaiqii]MBD0863846.1 cytochrome P450 [Gordonia jinghuaiqii]MCR5979932.1 cytochrome P450 [Gordonia jinghuaiqii]QMT03132.1 cytochrome P450 [Gordonia jinghuaiqii]
MSTSEVEVSSVDLLDPAALADPYPMFAALREDDPVHWNAKYRSWFITSFSDVTEALKEPRFTSNRITPYREKVLSRPGTDPLLREAFGVLDNWMVFKDPPDHTRLRRLLSRAFTPRSVSRMRPAIETIANELLDKVIARGDSHIDLIGDYAYPLTASVIAEMLGVPRQDRGRFKDWSDQISGLVFGSLGDEDRHRRGAQGMTELTGYLGDLVEAHERRPSDDLLSMLIAARENDDSLSHDEVIATGVLLLFAGHETTTNLIGNGISALLEHPAQQAALDRTDPAAVNGLVEELLRFDGPAKSVVRLVTEDMVWRGKRMSAGERVFLFLSSANRDPDAFEHPETFDISRRPGRQLGFSAGLHYCLGAPLARLETAIAVPTVIDRLPGLSPDPDDPISWAPTLLTRGMTRFPARYELPSGPAR